MSRKKQGKDKAEKAFAEDEVSKISGSTTNEILPAQTFDQYQCSGNVKIDFPSLCTLLDIKDIPVISSTPGTEELDTGDRQAQKNTASSWPKPCLQVELENENPLSIKGMKISGWKVDEQVARVLHKMLPSLNQLQRLQFWQARLTDPMVSAFMNTISLCSNLSVVILEGNPLPQQSYHVLLSEDSTLTHLSLRHNRIGDEGACLIGAALSTHRSSNKNLMSLNLAFNSIGDAGAAHIAQGLRLNRTLLLLSLSNNQIGDTGAAHLAAILGEFALTHEEVVERRKLLLEGAQPPCLDSDQIPADQLCSSSSTSLSVSKGESKSVNKKKEASKKDEKPPANKENPKSNKKSSDVKVAQIKSAKPGGKDRLSSHEDYLSTAMNEAELVETVNPLLDQSVQYRDGQLFLPGNTTLTSLNLAGNRITEKSLPLFLTSLEMQGEGGGLLRLCLQRNHFPPECESYVRIKELIALSDPLEYNSSEHTGGGSGC